MDWSLLHSFMMLIYIVAAFMEGNDIYKSLMGEEISMSVGLPLLLVFIIGLAIPLVSSVVIVLFCALLYLTLDANPLSLTCLALPGIFLDIVGYFAHKRSFLRRQAWKEKEEKARAAKE